MATLRVKDLDLARGEIVLRRGLGAKDRVTVWPDLLKAALAAYIESVRPLQQRDCDLGARRGVGCRDFTGPWDGGAAVPILVRQPLNEPSTV